jgi:hypothetical protein
MESRRGHPVVAPDLNKPDDSLPGTGVHSYGMSACRSFLNVRVAGDSFTASQAGLYQYSDCDTKSGGKYK